MRTNIIVTAVFAVTLLTNSMMASGVPAPLPDFLNKEQLAALQKARVIQPVEKPTTAPGSSQFYTGKPFDKSTGSYTFKYRSYNPELARWTSADPSGFPNWPNNYIYSNSPNLGFDRDGLIWQPNPGSGGQNIFGSNHDTGDYAGHNVWNPNPNYSGECATGAQYATGTDVNGSLHDAPPTRYWQQGDDVSGNSSVAPGEMIAYGWDDNGHYPNNSSGNHTALFVSQTSTTITVMEQFNDQYGNPTGFHQTTYSKSSHTWSVVTSDEKYDSHVSDSILE